MNDYLGDEGGPSPFMGMESKQGRQLRGSDSHLRVTLNCSDPVFMHAK